MSSDTVPSSQWTVDELLDSDPLTDPGGELRMVWSQLHHHLYVNTPSVVDAFCTLVRRRPQTPAKLVALHAVEQATGRLAQLVDEILVNDLLLYAHYRGSKLVASAIKSRWPHLDRAQRRAVVSHVEAADVVSPSFADLRGLIAAIPAEERTPNLERLLSELGGPRAREVEGPTIWSEKVEVKPTQSLAEQMAAVPQWLGQTPVPWDRILSALVEDEQSQRAELLARPVRQLSPSTAKQCADAALAALANHEPVDAKGAVASFETLVHVADIAMALPPLHEDDTLNAQLIEALRRHVFLPNPPSDSLVHAFMIVRRWHWRKPRGTELLLEIVRNASSGRVVKAALRPIWSVGAEVVAEVLLSLVDPLREFSADDGVPKEMGLLLGGYSLRHSSIEALMLGWLSTPPNGGAVRTDNAWNEVLRGAAFAIKNAAHHDPQVDPRTYGRIAAALWSAWQGPRSTAGGERYGMALFLMSPLHKSDRGESITARYWPVLRSLFDSIVTGSNGDEISNALFEIDLEALSPFVNELASILQRSASARSDAPVEELRDGRRRLAQVLRDLAMLRACPRQLASEIHETLTALGARKEVLDVERQWRT
jgi:hypothetical protein